MTFLDRYLAGEHEAVWQELRALGPAVRQPAFYDDALAVALETMRRVAQNIALVRERLIGCGYRFENSTGAYVRPAGNVRERIEEIESGPGHLPISLRAFYEVVGSVDLRQAWDQLVQYQRPERATAPEILILGEEDPVEVSSIEQLWKEAACPEARFGLSFCFAADEFHKANYSGGENYHVELPDDCMDFRISGMYGVDEWFVDYLRTSIRWGGFRGRIRLDPQDETRAYKETPKLEICSVLGADLVAF